MKFVFCEGGDDLALISGVAVSLGLADLQIEKFLGKNNLRQFLKDLQTRPEFATNRVQAMGIVRDADEDGDAAFRSVRDALTANGFNAPEENGIKTGVLIVGAKGGKGMVEDLCLDSVCHHREFSCMEDYFQCITQKSGRKDFSSKLGSASGWLRKWILSFTLAKPQRRAIGRAKVPCSIP